MTTLMLLCVTGIYHNNSQHIYQATHFSYTVKSLINSPKQTQCGQEKNFNIEGIYIIRENCFLVYIL
jgi:hypothetical protein